jgi:hypothetical protein
VFHLEHLLESPVPLGGALGRRPYKALRNVLTRKPHRFLPPNVTELRIPADRASTELMDEVFTDVEAVAGDDGLRALRATIERPAIRAAGRPLERDGRDYSFCSAITVDGKMPWRVVILAVRVVGNENERQLDSIHCKLVDPSKRGELRHDLTAIYREAEGRRQLILPDRVGAVWLRGNRAEDAPADWAAHAEGMAATYGIRLDVLVEPDVDPAQAQTRITLVKPAFAVVWDHDGRGRGLAARVQLPSLVEHLDGGWAEASLKADQAFARYCNVSLPQRAMPRDVAEAVRQARAHPDVIILPAARRSANSSVFRRPLDARTALEAVVDAVAAGGVTGPGGLERALTGAPFRYASGVSATAHNQYRASYEREYNGRTVLLAPHLKLGAGSPEFCLRIYWYVDAEEGKVVVGHIGEHLPDAGRA